MNWGSFAMGAISAVVVLLGASVGWALWFTWALDEPPAPDSPSGGDPNA